MPKRKKREITNPMVAEVYFNYTEAIQSRLLFLRDLIFQTAEASIGVGEIEETLKWGEPSYVTKTRSGTTIRLHTVRNQPNKYAIYFNCKTNLIDSLRDRYPTKLNFSGNRAIVFDINEEIPVGIVQDTIYSALTYHMKKIEKKEY